MSSLVYQQRTPSNALAPWVECFWSLTGPDHEVAAQRDAAAAARGAVAPGSTTAVGHGDPHAGSAEPPPERVLPDGRIEFVFNFGGPVWQMRDGGDREVQPTELLVGPTTRAVLIRPTGVIRMLGVRLRHGVAAVVLGVPAAELTDSMHSLGDVAPFATSLREQLAEQSRFHAQVSVLERHLLERLARSRHRSARSSLAAVSRILASGGAIDVATIASSVGVSTRQLVRRFAHDVGTGPKLLARLVRLHGLLRLVETDRPRTLASAAARAGYTDQSHLVRDFREFAGVTPREYFRSTNQLTEYFLELDRPEPGNGSRHRG